MALVLVVGGTGFSAAHCRCVEQGRGSRSGACRDMAVSMDVTKPETLQALAGAALVVD